MSLMIALSACDREECIIQLIAVVLSHKREKMYPSRFLISCGSRFFFLMWMNDIIEKYTLIKSATNSFVLMCNSLSA